MGGTLIKSGETDGSQTGSPWQPRSSRESARPAFLSVMPYILAIFLSAFLLFQVEPIIARYILPWFGGSPSTWTTCMLFFQVLLLGGYAYAHLLARYLSPRHQVLVHLTLVACSLVFLPITPGEGWKPEGHENPLLRIVLLLLVTIGGPFFLVSASCPLLQHWFNRVYPTLSPYRLYALSNLGSLLGLLSYPFLVEPHLGLKAQTVLWSAGYGLYAIMCAWGATPLLRFAACPGSSRNAADLDDDNPRVPERLLTLALPACGSVILLASTNQMCRDVAVVPFLWVLPLSLYLISFILCFDHERWYNRFAWIPLLLTSLSAVVYLMHQDYAEEEMNLYFQIFIYSAALFACCMVCHGELVRLKPPAQYLTSFYLMVALGGALGGVFVNLIAPFFFKGYWEFHAGLVATVFLVGLCLFREREPRRASFVRWSGRILWIGSLGTLAAFLWLHIQEQQKSSILTERNFYGVLRVYESDVGTTFAHRSLYHGRISHGEQFLSPRLRARPRTYYGPNSGISLALTHHPRHRRPQNQEDGAQRQRGLQVGIIGLGVGTIAAYSRPGDTFRFYEIDPDVIWISRDYFTYLKDGKGTQQVVQGDGRISLEREWKSDDRQPFDILAMDAFTGDAVPIHLLTREAFDLYWHHLAPDGILAINITNLHIDLSPVVRALARELGKQAVWIEDLGEDWDEDSDEDLDAQQGGTDGNDWVLVTSNTAFLTAPVVSSRIEPWPTARPKEILWTDDYSNLFEVVSP